MGVTAVWLSQRRRSQTTISQLSGAVPWESHDFSRVEEVKPNDIYKLIARHSYSMKYTRSSMTEPPSLAVINEIAEEEDINPVNIKPPLNTVIDADALDRLFAGSERTDGRVTFEYSGYRVTIDSDGNVEIDHLKSAQKPHSSRE
jgi:hypothetical protein